MEAVHVSDGQQIELAALEPGSALDHPLLDKNGVLLLPAGTRITLEHRERLRARGLTHAVVGANPGETRATPTQVVPEAPCDPAARAEATAAATQAMGQLESGGDMARLAQREDTTRPGESLGLDELHERVQAGTQRIERDANFAAQAARTLITGGAVDGKQLTERVRSVFDLLQSDRALAGHLARLDGRPDDYLFPHAVSSGLIAMHVAHYAGFSNEAVIATGVAALIHDTGMLRMDPAVRLAARPLTDNERFDMQMHPTFTANAVESERTISGAAKVIAYQVHERDNGSGYPRGRNGSAIHPLARVLGIADCYAAMTAARPHRPAMRPFDAAGELLRMTAQGLFCRAAVRWFIESMGVHPIGSYVQISRHRIGRVIRANCDAIKRPVVQLLDDRFEMTDRTLNLQRSPLAEIVGVIDAPATMAG